MDEDVRIKKELTDIITRSLMIGLKNGHINKDQYIQLMQELKDMQNDSPEEIRALVELIGLERNEKNGPSM